MRKGHLDIFKPVCPLCRQSQRGDRVLALGPVCKQEGEQIVEGFLLCPDASCKTEYPIVDGIPIIVSNVAQFVTDNIQRINSRADLSPTMESLLGDSCGGGSVYDQDRQHLSAYVQAHYGHLLTVDEHPPKTEIRSSALELLDAGLRCAGQVKPGPVIDVGASVGMTCFGLAKRYGQPVLGVDLNISMLRFASALLRNERMQFCRRRLGTVYDAMSIQAPSDADALVDFWACDAIALPFAQDTAALVTSFNILDCVASPLDHLRTICGILSQGGKVILTTPYDWAPTATPPAAWIGGHSQRNEKEGSSELILRQLLTGQLPQSIPGVKLVSELPEVPWRLQLHQRSEIEYQVHLVVLEAD
jgi:SAM-dependent methyltransferase/uncharacterized protein YbaR (Trm112 family)